MSLALLVELLSKDWCGVIEEVKEPYELFGRFIGEVFEGERRSGAMDEGEEEEPGEELSIFFGDDELLGDGGVAGGGGSCGGGRRRKWCRGKKCGAEEEVKGFALMVRKFDGLQWWCGVCSKVGGENEGEECFGVGCGVKESSEEVVGLLCVRLEFHGSKRR